MNGTFHKPLKKSNILKSLIFKKYITIICVNRVSWVLNITLFLSTFVKSKIHSPKEIRLLMASTTCYLFLDTDYVGASRRRKKKLELSSLKHARTENGCAKSILGTDVQSEWGAGRIDPAASGTCQHPLPMVNPTTMEGKTIQSSLRPLSVE